MNNRRLTLLYRARMSILSAIRHAKEPLAETSLRHALLWVTRAREATMKGLPADSAMQNAITHLQQTSICLGFTTYLDAA